MKKIIVIGAGITGCVIGYYLSLKGHKVEIYEQSQNIGGVMKDSIFKKKRFFSGPHYLNPNSSWFKKLFSEKESKKIFNLFGFSYGSFTDIFDEKLYVESFAHPSTRKKFKGLVNIKRNNLLINRLKIYQKEVSNKLIEWVKIHTKHYLNLHENCSDILAISRLQFLKDRIKLKKLKKNSLITDQLIGLPNKNLDSISAILPSSGNDIFFNFFSKKLKKRGVKINTNKKIYLRKEGSSIQVFENKKKLFADHFIWTANPVPLIKISNNRQLDNPFINSFLMYFDVIKNPNKINNYYTQVFSIKKKITRIFIYKISGKYRLTVEGIYDKDFNIKLCVENIKSILKYLDKEIIKTVFIFFSIKL